MRFGFAFALALLVVGCGQNSDTMTRYHEDGRAKPVLAIASMIDTSSFDAPWSLSEELTSLIVQRLAQTNQIFVEAQEDCVFAENPFGADLSWVKREFHSHEFVAFLELVEHENVFAPQGKKNTSPQELSTNLNMAVRVRVVDLRGAAPKIVLQEIIKESYFIPKTLIPTDYRTVTWGSGEYPKTPMGIAHMQLVQEVSLRIKDYILLAKSR